MDVTDVDRIAAGYDIAYGAIPRSPTFQRIWRERSLGDEYPEGFEHISFLTLAEMRWMAEQLRLSHGERLVDLACGMGGPGLWIAQTTGAQLIGVDVSDVALALARERADTLQLADSTRFVRGAFAETGLERASVDGVMTVDALQYAPDKQAAVDEVARILCPGGRFVFACFALDPARVAGVPILGTDPVDDYRPLLERAGFDVLSYGESENWSARVTDTYQAVINAKDELTQEMGEAAYNALFGEMSLTLQLHPYSSRVLVCAQRR